MIFFVDMFCLWFFVLIGVVFIYKKEIEFGKLFIICVVYVNDFVVDLCVCIFEFYFFVLSMFWIRVLFYGVIYGIFFKIIVCVVIV